MTGILIASVYSKIESIANEFEGQKLLASNGLTTHNFGYSCDIYEDTIVVGAPNVSSGRGAFYIFKYNGSIWEQTSNITGAVTNSALGTSVSIFNNTLVVGIPSLDNSTRGENSGAANIYEFNGTSWVLKNTVYFSSSTSAGAGHELGRTVAVNNDTIVVGAPVGRILTNAFQTGYVIVYRKIDSIWTEIQRFASPTNSVSPVNHENFGSDISVFNDTMVIVSFGNSKIRVYKFNGSTWDFFQELDEPGRSATVYNDIIVVGNYQFNENNGKIVIYQFDGTSYVIVQTEISTDTVPLTTGYRFGSGVRLYNNNLIVSAAGDLGVGGTSATSSAGAVFVYTYDGTSWVRTHKFVASDGGRNDYLAGPSLSNRNIISMAIYNNTIIAGAYGDDDKGSDAAGAAYVFNINP